MLGIRRAKRWNDMPLSVQRHWETLGWSKWSWTGAVTPPPSVDTDWHDLSDAEMAAAKALGYSYTSWENDPADPFAAEARALTALPASIVLMKSQRWHELTQYEQMQWRTLGWDDRSWDDAAMAKPASADKEYKELDAREKKAADQLGYTPETWDADDDSGNSGTSGSTPYDIDDASFTIVKWVCVFVAHSLAMCPLTLPSPRRPPPTRLWERRFRPGTMHAHDGGARRARACAWLHVPHPTLQLTVASVLGLGAYVASGWSDATAERAKADAKGGRTTHLQRQPEAPRPEWRARVRAAGLTFAELPGVYWGWEGLYNLLSARLVRRLGLDEPYWNESASYRLSDEGAWRIVRPWQHTPSSKPG